jgi:hypothetical protein
MWLFKDKWKSNTCGSLKTNGKKAWHTLATNSHLHLHPHPNIWIRPLLIACSHSAQCISQQCPAHAIHTCLHLHHASIAPGGLPQQQVRRPTTPACVLCQHPADSRQAQASHTPAEPWQSEQCALGGQYTTLNIHVNMYTYCIFMYIHTCV